MTPSPGFNFQGFPNLIKAYSRAASALSQRASSPNLYSGRVESSSSKLNPNNPYTC